MFFCTEEHARQARAKSGGTPGAYLSFAQAEPIVRKGQSELFGFPRQT